MKIRKRKESDFIIDLEQNALGSLLHGIEHYVDALKWFDSKTNTKHRSHFRGEIKHFEILIFKHLKFTIMHVSHAIELFLKARLAKAHQLLIYLKPENEINDDTLTVGFDSLLGRLKNIGVILTKEETDDLKALRKTRHSIEHHEIQKDIESVKMYIGRATRFLEKFLNNEFNIKLKEEILNDESLEKDGEEMYRTLSEAIYSYEERLQKAKGEMNEYLPYDSKERFIDKEIALCKLCGEETIIIPDDRYDDKRAECFFCGEIYFYEHCNRCGLPILSFRPLKAGEYSPCSYCWHEIMSKE
ncbi:MAG: hypothetical protein FD156_1090 [Nitrospirae bacterium]|nr:MAG: hypothetical protein FD156_1090 [Nitrospirota bacterium]